MNMLLSTTPEKMLEKVSKICKDNSDNQYANDIFWQGKIKVISNEQSCNFLQNSTVRKKYSNAVNVKNTHTLYDVVDSNQPKNGYLRSLLATIFLSTKSI